MALNYETLIRAAGKSPEQRTTNEISDFIFPWLKQSLKKKQGIFQKISDEVIYDICKSVILERRPAWQVVIRQGDPGDKFYIILQGSVNIYRFDEDGPQSAPLDIDTVKEFSALDGDPDKREELIAQLFGNYIITLGGGSDFGERALVTNEPRSATVMTISPTDLLVVEREVFNRTLKAAHEKELQEKVEFINRCPLFSSWSPRLKRLVSLSLERGRFSYDSILFKQGTPADAVYFVWSGEIKITMDPLMHWLQYPYLLPQSDSMKKRALQVFMPTLRPAQQFNFHVASTTDTTSFGESLVIQRRHMTYSQAENERTQRVLQLSLLTVGDIVGLESYVGELNTYMNSARCTAQCDLFYILKHNFARLQKRYGVQGLTDRLREMALLSLQAYPQHILNLPIHTALMKRQLASNINIDQTQYHNKQSWLLRVKPSQSPTRRTITNRYTNSKGRSPASPVHFRPDAQSSGRKRLGHVMTQRYLTSDQIQVEKIEDRLKKWHAEMGDDSKAQIRPLTRLNVARASPISIGDSLPFDNFDLQPSGTMISTSTSGDIDVTSDNPTSQLLVNLRNPSNHCSPTNGSNNYAYLSKFNLPPLQTYTKQEQYKEMQATLKQAWINFNKRPTATIH